MLSPEVADFFSLWADVAVIVTAASVLLFVLIYGSLYRWREKRAGRSVFFMFLALLIVSLISFLAVWIGSDYWLRPLWRAVAWTAAGFAGLYVLYALIRNWNRRESISVEPRTGNIPVTKEES